MLGPLSSKEDLGSWLAELNLAVSGTWLPLLKEDGCPRLASPRPLQGWSTEELNQAAGPTSWLLDPLPPRRVWSVESNANGKESTS